MLRTINRRFFKLSTAAVLLLFASTICTIAMANDGSANIPIFAKQHFRHALQVDVVQNGTDFFFEGPVNENGIPAKGTPFVTTAFIYPSGTLLAYGASSGIKANGDPEFPELAISLHVSGSLLE